MLILNGRPFRPDFWVVSHGYQLHQLNAAGWKTSQECQVEIGKAPAFPEDFQGDSLDAFRDWLGDVAGFEFGADPVSSGTVLVLRTYDNFARANAEIAQIILDIWADCARRGLLFGHRMLWLVQSNDPKIKFGAVGASPVMWNPQEWLDSNRQ